MNGYVTKKDNLRVFKADRGEQRGKSFVRGRGNNENGKTSGEIISALLREFRGDIVGGDKIILYPL